MAKTILTITLSEQDGAPALQLEAVASKRFQFHGFGTFLPSIKKGEVAITEEALDALLSGTEQSGIQGMEFWSEKMLAWGSQSQSFLVAVRDINVARASRRWIKELFEVKGS